MKIYDPTAVKTLISESVNSGGLDSVLLLHV